MYAWIEGQKWAADDQPPLTEKHGMLVADGVINPQTGRPEWYGKIVGDEDELTIVRALLQRRLMFDFEEYEDLG